MQLMHFVGVEEAALELLMVGEMMAGGGPN